MATSAERLYEIALDELSEQRATVDRARAAVAPVNAVAVAITAALAKSAFEASGVWPSRCAVIGVVGAAVVLVCGAIILLEPLGKLELVLRAEAIGNNEAVQRSLDDPDAFQSALAQWIGSSLIKKNTGGLLRVRITLAAMLLALGVEAAGLALASVLPMPKKPPCAGSRHKQCVKSSSGLALTTIRLTPAGVLHLRGRLDENATGSLQVSVAFNHGSSGHTMLIAPITSGEFAVTARPIIPRKRVCDARYMVLYPGLRAIAGASVTGDVAIPCRLPRRNKLAVAAE